MLTTRETGIAPVLGSQGTSYVLTEKLVKRNSQTGVSPLSKEILICFLVDENRLGTMKALEGPFEAW